MRGGGTTGLIPAAVGSATMTFLPMARRPTQTDLPTRSRKAEGTGLARDGVVTWASHGRVALISRHLLCELMAEPSGGEFLHMAQRFLDEGRFEKAREAIERGYERDPTDTKVSELFQQIYLAQGIRDARRARDLRRDHLRVLRKGERARAQDPRDVSGAFLVALESFDRVLQANPENLKGVLLKAATLFRQDRLGNRDRVGALLERALEIHPENHELSHARWLVTHACENCSDTGFCQACGGTGQVSALLVKSVCPQCRGSGVCNRCGII